MGTADERIPTFAFLSQGMSGAAALAAYHESTRDIYPCHLYPGQSADDFKVEMTGWHLGLFLLASIRATPLMFDRSASVVAESGLDGVTVQLYTEGGFAGMAGRRPVAVSPGDICVFDLRQTVQTRASAFHTHSLMATRKVFEAALGDPAALHGFVMPAASPMTQLLAAHFNCLVERASDLTPRQAMAAAQGTIALIAAVLRGLLPDCEKPEARIVGSPFRAIADHIERHLDDPNLGPGTLTHAFGMSRAALYRLFTEVGGVSAYIRRQRLTAAALALASADSRQRIKEIAQRFGFVREAEFCRGFRSHFGVSPGEARRRAGQSWEFPADRREETLPGRDFRAWSKNLR